MAKCHECDREPEYVFTLKFNRLAKGSGWTATWALCHEHAMRAQQIGFDPRKPFYEAIAELAAKPVEVPCPTKVT
jgi:hypothetical protein